MKLPMPNVWRRETLVKSNELPPAAQVKVNHMSDQKYVILKKKKRILFVNVKQV